MTEPTPRKRFQIHLSTAIVMMFVAGGLMWANARERSVFPFLSDDRADNGAYVHYTKAYGWPFDAAGRGVTFLSDGVYGTPWSIFGGCLIDLAIAFIVLFAVWFVCEWLIRRRGAQKES